MRYPVLTSLAALAALTTSFAQAQSVNDACTAAQTAIQKFLDEGEPRSASKNALESIHETLGREGLSEKTCTSIGKNSAEVIDIESRYRERVARSGAPENAETGMAAVEPEASATDEAQAEIAEVEAASTETEETAEAKPADEPKMTGDELAAEVKEELEDAGEKVEEKAAEAEPADGEEKTAEAEAEPADGEEKTAEAEAEPAEGEEKTAEAEADPAEGEEKTAEAEADPAEGEEKTAEAEADPAEGEEKTAEAEADPTEGEEKTAEAETDPAEGEENSAEAETDPAEAEEETAGAEVEAKPDDGAEELAAVAVPAAAAAAVAANALESSTVDSLIGREVFGNDGESLGEVDMVVTRDSTPYLIVSHGGFLGIAETEIGIEADRFEIGSGNVLLLPDMTEEKFDALEDWDEDDYPEASEDETIGALRTAN